MMNTTNMHPIFTMTLVVVILESRMSVGVKNLHVR